MGCLGRLIITIGLPAQGLDVRLWDRAGEDVSGAALWAFSSDGVCWAAWTDRASYEALRGDAPWVRAASGDRPAHVTVAGEKTDCFSVCREGAEFVSGPCDNVWDPYAGLDCAMALQQQMADKVICLFGIPAYYFKVDPDRSSAEHVFKEWTLYGVTDCKMVKIMPEDGQMPSSRPQMSEFDFAFDGEWEVEVSRTQFATAFGAEAVPMVRDFLYVPMMGRMYDVNAAYDEKAEGLMWRATTWKLALTKYEDSYNVDGGDFNEIIDKLTGQTHDSAFSALEEIETSGARQPLPEAARNTCTVTGMQDKERSLRVGAADVVARELRDGGARIAVSAYAGAGEIVYSKRVCRPEWSVCFIGYGPGDGAAVGPVGIRLTDGGLDMAGHAVRLSGGWPRAVWARFDPVTMSASYTVWSHEPARRGGGWGELSEAASGVTRYPAEAQPPRGGHPVLVTVASGVSSVRVWDGEPTDAGKARHALRSPAAAGGAAIFDQPMRWADGLGYGTN